MVLPCPLMPERNPQRVLGIVVSRFGRNAEQRTDEQPRQGGMGQESVARSHADHPDRSTCSLLL
jgi:hypothetical protein